MTEPFLSDFLDSVRRTGLLAEEAVQTLTDEFRLQPPTSREELASRLVERGTLTAYQAERLLQGMPEDVVLAERYQLLEKIGSGGMGTVFRARDTRLNRIVAIKVMAPQHLSQPDAVERFKREARLLAQLTLPNIVQAFDSGEDRGRNFLVMEYVKGVGLEKVLREKGEIAPTVAADYIYQTALGMERAHERGLIHRDLKPANLLLTHEGEIKILDLGLARFVQDQVPDQLTRDNIGMGTPDYMPPEQFRDAHSVDPRADIYSLGCTLYHLISGLVPFPGSSFSEKARAHENKEPPPLVERCPEIPAGLEMAISKMMAKRQGDRHQTMGEVVEALAPYVASSSHSLPKVTQTLTWQGRKLAAATRRRPGRFVAAALVFALVGAVAAWGLPRMLRQEDPPNRDNVADLTGKDAPAAKDAGDKKDARSFRDDDAKKDDKKIDDKSVADGKTVEKKSDKKADDKKEEKKPPLVVTIPNGITVAQDGSGQAKTLNEALDKIEAGQTIRVLDKAIYREKLHINRAGQHANITIEAVKGATILTPEDTQNLIVIEGVPGVTLRGLRLRGDTKFIALIYVHRRSPGTVVEDLHLSAKKAGTGIEFSTQHVNGTPISHIRNNTFVDLGYAVSSIGCGAGAGYSRPMPTGRIRIENNEIVSCDFGVLLMGEVRQVQMAANRVLYSGTAAFELENLLGGAGDILFANNTVLDSAEAFRLWDSKLGGANITFANNLFLGDANKDMVYFDSGGDRFNPKGPGDGGSVRDRWTLLCNWREQRAGMDSYKDWIKPAPSDQVLPKIAVQSRLPADKGFLMPTADAKFATEGAGKTHAAFPTYAGAVPPSGAAAWDWQWTWDAFFEKKLTVAQDPKAKARFNSLNAAVDALWPGCTIEILDDAIYGERIAFDDPGRHKNTTLVAAKGATIEMNGGDEAIHIHAVPGVTIRGLAFAGKKLRVPFVSSFIHIEGACPGTLVEKISVNCNLEVCGVYIRNSGLSMTDAPITVRDCDIETSGTGVVLTGVAATPASNILVYDNKIKATKGIGCEIHVTDVLAAGNAIQGGRMASIELRGLHKDCKNILVANNTCFGGEVSVRVWDDVASGVAPADIAHREGQVELIANVLVRASLVDMVLVNARMAKISPQKSDHLPKLWRFEANWRDMRGELTGPGTPLVKSDHLLKADAFESLAPSNEKFLIPKTDSGVATGGAGMTNPGFPIYAGAAPPDGMPRCDWGKTWAARREKR